VAVKEEIYKGMPASKGISMGKPWFTGLKFLLIHLRTANRLPDKEISEYKQAIEQ
jgi:hypothetical protein